MSEASDSVQLTVEDDEVLAVNPLLLTDRKSRLFFGSLLGARAVEDGWQCPRRRQTIETIVVRINTFLERNGWVVEGSGTASLIVQNEQERKQSFERTHKSAVALREGDSAIDVIEVEEKLNAFGWDSDERDLREHQKLGLVHGLTGINTANFSVPGSGKTATTLAVAASHMAVGTVDLVLVVGPLSCFAPWEKEIRAALPTKFNARRVRGTASHRRALYPTTEEGDVLLISYATAASDQLQLLELCRRHRVMLVIDESHRVKRFSGGVWAPALTEIAKSARVRTILSGTPMPQSGKDLFSQLNILWPSGELTGPKAAFAARTERDFSSVLKDVQPFISRTPKSALGLEDYEIIRHEVPLIGTQAEIYELIENNFRRHLEKTSAWRDKIEVLRRARPIRLIQAAANPDLLNSKDTHFKLSKFQDSGPTLLERLAAYREIEVPAKCKAALTLVRQLVEANQKVVCWSNFLRNLDYFADLVRTEIGVETLQVDGRVPAGDVELDDLPTNKKANPEDVDSRERIIERFLRSEDAAVLVANPAACSESISLHQTCHRAIYLDRTYDCALFLQSIDRIHRLGLPPGTDVHVDIFMATINGRPTADHLVDSALKKKDRRMRELLESAEITPLGLDDDPLGAAEGDTEDLNNLLDYLLGRNVE